MCDCFHLAFPNWHAASSGTAAGRRLRAPEPATEDLSACDEAPQFAEGERPRPQGSSPVEEHPESAKYTDGAEEYEEEHDLEQKSGQKGKKSGLGSIFERTSTPKMSKLKEVQSPEAGVIVKTAKDGCAEGLVYGGGGKEGIFIKEVVPESPASKSLKLKEGDQILSATVYFDNMPYEDAIQILEHAQAYKVKLCLKRKPDMTEGELTTERDLIPEEDPPELRTQGRTKRRGDVRISWPKFPSFGKGRKSGFTRSHSTSEADEQRKLEISPTTSDTESPIKSQDALKGKKKHRIKLSSLKKRGRISSSEEQDTEAPTAAQISVDVMQTKETDTPQESEGLSREAAEVRVIDYMIPEKDFDPEQLNQTQSEQQNIQQKEELSTETTLKTADLTVAMSDQESPAGTPKSSNGKKKKKERSELKMKILGKDKSHKKDTKVKSSPKRLKTLGASLEAAAPPETEEPCGVSKSESNTQLLVDEHPLDTDNQVMNEESPKMSCSKSVTGQMSLPKVELDIHVRKPQKGEEEKKQKIKEAKQKKATKASPKLKQPERATSNITSTEELQRNESEDSTTKPEQTLDDPFARLSKSSTSITLPKREDIEIPGMEDTLKITPKSIQISDSDPETLQMSIDVDSVKEAVSKLPGYKLPKVDTSGMPIPEEITVIDANAQRISVKTPTKVVELKSKHEALIEKFSKAEIPKASIKVSKFMSSGSKMEVRETKKEGKIWAFQKGTKQTNGSSSIKPEHEPEAPKELQKKRRAQLMPNFGITTPKIALPHDVIDLQHKESKTEMSTDEKEEKVMYEVNIPNTDTMEFIDSVDESATNKDGTHDGIKQTAGVLFSVKDEDTEAQEKRQMGETLPDSENVNILAMSYDSDKNLLQKDGKGSKFKMPVLDISLPKVKGPTLEKTDIEIQISKKHQEDIPPERTEDKVELLTPEDKIKPSKSQGYIDEQISKLKLSKFGVKTPKIKDSDMDSNEGIGSQKDERIKALNAEERVQTKEGQESVEASMLEQKPALESQTSGGRSDAPELGMRFKIPKFGLRKTAVQGPEVDLNLSRKDAKTPEQAGAEDKLSEASKTVITPGKGGVFILKKKTDVKKTPGESLKTESEFIVQGGKFKIPKLGITMPKTKGQDIIIISSGKDTEVTQTEAGAEAQPSERSEVTAEQKMKVEKTELEIKSLQNDGETNAQGHTFTLPKLGIAMPTQDVSVQEAKGDKKNSLDTIIQDSDMGSLPDGSRKTFELDVKSSKFKMPKLGISIPKMKDSEAHVSSFKTAADVSLPADKDEVRLSGAEPDTKVVHVAKQDELPKLQAASLNQLSDAEGGVEFPIEGSANLTSQRIHAEVPSVGEITKETHQQGPKFSVPHVSFPESNIIKPDGETDKQEANDKTAKIDIKMPTIKTPEFHFGVLKNTVDATTPEVKLDIKVPDAEIKSPTATTHIASSMAEAKGLDEDIDKQTETKVEVQVPEVTLPENKMEVGRPEVQPHLKLEGGKFKMPKLGIKMPKVRGSGSGLDVSKNDVDETSSKEQTEAKKFEVNLKESSDKLKFKSPEMQCEITQSSMFKSPNLRFDNDAELPNPPELSSITEKTEKIYFLHSSKMDADTTQSDTKGEASLPTTIIKQPTATVNIKTTPTETPKKGSPSKFKMPTIKLPKLGLGTSASERDAKLEIIETNFSEEVLAVTIVEPTNDSDGPSIDIKTLEPESDRKTSKFKVPGFGFSGSTSKREKNVTLPEGKTEIKLPDVGIETSAEVEAQDQESEGVKMDKDGSPSKFKMPTFKLPKFGHSTKGSLGEVPPVDDLQLETHLLSTEGASIESGGPKVDLKSAGIDRGGKGRKFKLPSLGFSATQAKKQDIDSNLDMTLPEPKAEVELPDVDIEKSAEIQAEVPDMKDVQKDTEGSPLKFKMPTFKLPKFGITSTKEAPAFDEEIKTIEGAPEISAGVLDFGTTELSLEHKVPSADIKISGSELEGKVGKVKMPGFSGSESKGPDINLSLSERDAVVTLQEINTDIKLPNDELKKSMIGVEIQAPESKSLAIDADGSVSKFKMPSFKLPKFGLASSQGYSEEVPPVDKNVTKDGGEIQTLAEFLDVGTEESIEIKGSSRELKPSGSNAEGKRRFKLPSLGFSVSEAKVTETDISLSKRDVDVSLPEEKAEVKLPDVGTEKALAKIEAETPDIKAVKKDTESPSKFKMPTFKLPKFAISSQSSAKEEPALDKDIQTEGDEANVSEGDLNIGTSEVNTGATGLSVDITDAESDHEAKKKKIKLPSFGFSVSDVTDPKSDLYSSKKDGDLPEVQAGVRLKDDEWSTSGAEGEMKSPEFKGLKQGSDGSPSKFKMPTFKLPKFGLVSQSSTEEVPAVDKNVKKGEIQISEEILEVSAEGENIEIKCPSVETKPPGSDHDGKGKKFKLPSLGFSLSETKGSDIDLSLSKRDTDVTIQEVKAVVKLPDDELNKSSIGQEMKAPEIKSRSRDADGSPSRFKIPTFKLPKFGLSTQSSSKEVPSSDKDVKSGVDEVKLSMEIPPHSTERPNIEISQSVDIPSESEQEIKTKKFKLPSLGFSVSQPKGSDTEVGLKTDVDITQPEIKAEVKVPETEVPETKYTEMKGQKKDAEGSPSKFKMPTFKFPRFGLGAHSSVEEVPASGADVKTEGGEIQFSEDEPTVDKDKTYAKLYPDIESYLNADKGEPKKTEVTLPSLEVKRQEGTDVPSIQSEGKSKRANWTFPKMSFSKTTGETPEADLTSAPLSVDTNLPEEKAEVRLSREETKDNSTGLQTESITTEDKSKDIRGSPLKLKMPTVKLPKLGGASYDVTGEAQYSEKSGGNEPREGETITIKASKVDVKTDASKTDSSDREIEKSGTEDHGSTSKFKLPAFKIPRLGLSRGKPEEESVIEDGKEEQQDDSNEDKSSKVTLTSFGDMLKSFNVDIGVPKVDKAESNLETHKTDESSRGQSETKEEKTKVTESSSWFKFPKFGLSSPTEAPKSPEKAKQKDGGSPAQETTDEEFSPASSGPSSNAFADVSSTLTSEPAEPSSLSPSKVTAKYSDPGAATGLGEIHEEILSSAARTELISGGPNLPEKITILSSGVSSSSEDTVRLDSGKIHIITSNIQATPQSQQAKLLTPVQIQPAAGLSLETETRQTESWTLSESQSSQRTLTVRHFVQETSAEQSESKEVSVVTKQITRIIDTSELISGETASSIQRLKRSVHSEKMRFFDEAEK